MAGIHRSGRHLVPQGIFQAVCFSVLEESFRSAGYKGRFSTINGTKTQMKHFLFTTIAAVLLVGCGPQPPDISIIDAAKQGNIEAVKQHIAAGTDVNVKDKVGGTPLHHAAWQGHKEVIELLIAKGADVNATDRNGKTPLDRADNKETADLLRKHGGKTGEELKAEGK